MAQISVVVTNFNYGNLLGRCLRSLVDQSLDRTEYEVIVVDDASSDHSREVLKSFIEYVKPIFNEVNIGLAESCNIGLRAAHGRFVVRVDADDYVHKDFLKVLCLYLGLNAESCDAVAVDYLEVDEDEKVISRKCQENEPLACGIAFKMDVLNKLGLYKAGLRIHEDKELLSRFREGQFRLDFLKIPLYRYKKHPHSLTAKAVNNL